MRMTCSQTRRRSAITLIELLTVIAIIAILGAMVAGAIHRVIGSQQLKRTEATVKKTQGGFETQWKAAIDDAKEEIKNGRVSKLPSGAVNPLLAQVGGDRDIANALYIKMRLKIEFPQTFNEARNPGLAAYGLQAKGVYTNELTGALASPAAGSGTPQEESAVLLFLALSQTRRGATLNADEMGGTVKVLRVGGRDFKVIADAWGNPISFQRWAQDAWAAGNIIDELSNPPYAPAGSNNYPSNINKDTTDPYGKLKGSFANKATFVNLLADPMTGHNRGPVLRSWGPDRIFNTNDDIMGYRLMKEGQLGN